jgi:hypothetical protein
VRAARRRPWPEVWVMRLLCGWVIRGAAISGGSPA